MSPTDPMPDEGQYWCLHAELEVKIAELNLCYSKMQAAIWQHKAGNIKEPRLHRTIQAIMVRLSAVEAEETSISKSYRDLLDNLKNGNL